MKRGFTFTELIVVIVVIAILMALALPALQSARGAARKTECSSNIRQFHFAYRLPVADRPVANRCPDDPNGFGFFQNRMWGYSTFNEQYSTTFEYFEHAGGAEYALFSPMEHVEPIANSSNWFPPVVTDPNITAIRVHKFIATDRHHDGTSNYLYWDGHVDSLPSEFVEGWIQQQFNFCAPGNATPPSTK